MFVPILTDMFKHSFTQEVIPGSITKGVITLKILARVLANRLQLVIIDLIGPRQNYAVKGRSILVRQILEGIENDTEAEFGGGFGDRQIRTGVPQIHQYRITINSTHLYKPKVTWLAPWKS